MPPVHSIPPEAGQRALECTWPYHFKESLGTLLGARCNHDVAVLGRLLVLPSDIQDQLQEGTDFKDLPSEVRGELFRDLSSGIVDRSIMLRSMAPKRTREVLGSSKRFPKQPRYTERNRPEAAEQNLL